jgi:hypothetical protein
MAARRALLRSGVVELEPLESGGAEGCWGAGYEVLLTIFAGGWSLTRGSRKR